MTISIIPVKPDHVPLLGDICFRAFSTLQDRHAVERDFDSAETGRGFVGMFSSRPDIAGFTAVDATTGRVLGSNFLQFSDAVAGVGPITVDPDVQSTGVGRLLMLAVMDEARRRGISRVRLQQEAINTTSLSLYTKLGFDWRVACSLMRAAPAAQDDPRIRPLTPHDLPAIDEISTRHYHTTRRVEVEALLSMGIAGFGFHAGGKLSGYYFPSLIGHGFAESDADLASLVTHAARHTPPHFLKTLVPLSENGLHRELLARGCRSIKLFNYMSTGEYRPPVGAWMPSIGM